MSDMDIESMAKIAHEANRALQLTFGDPAQSPAWEDAPEWQRESAIEGVVAALAGTTPEEQHVSWCESKKRDGWTWGPAKIAELRRHPCLVPYDQLPADQKAKDAVFVAIVNAAKEL